MQVRPWSFFVRLVALFCLTFALWQPVAPAYTQLLLGGSRVAVRLTELTGGPTWRGSTTLMSRGTGIFYTNRNFAALQPPIQPQGIPAEWVMANLLLLLPLMLATPAPSWKVRFVRLAAALAIAFTLQVADIVIGIKSFYANTFRGLWSPGARQIYQFLDAFFQSWDTQLFPFAIWAGIHFRELLAIRARTGTTQQVVTGQTAGAERRRRKRKGS